MKCPLNGQTCSCGSDTWDCQVIEGREGKPRTGSESVLLRESTAPNADKIRSLEAFENGAVPRIARLERNLEAQLAVNRSLVSDIAQLKRDVAGLRAAVLYNTHYKHTTQRILDEGTP